MPKLIDYYFTPVSPFTYLGHDRFVAIAREAGATIAVKAINLGDVFPVSGGLPLSKRAPQRISGTSRTACRTPKVPACAPISSTTRG